jgi:hypothetical protein
VIGWLAFCTHASGTLFSHFHTVYYSIRGRGRRKHDLYDEGILSDIMNRVFWWIRVNVGRGVFPFLHKGIFNGIIPTKDQVTGN